MAVRNPHTHHPSAGILSQLMWGTSVPAVWVNTQHEHAHKNCLPPHTHTGRLAAAAIPPCCFRAFAAKRTEFVSLPPALQAASPKPHFYSPFTALLQPCKQLRRTKAEVKDHASLQ